MVYQNDKWATVMGRDRQEFQAGRGGRRRKFAISLKSETDGKFYERKSEKTMPFQ